MTTTKRTTRKTKGTTATTDGCEFVQRQPHEWFCTVHKSLKVAGTSEPVSCDAATTTQTDGERILAAITKALAVLKERFALRPAEGFVYGYKDALNGADYQRCEYFPYHPDEPDAAFFEVCGVLAAPDRAPGGGKFGGTSFGLVPVNDATVPRIKGARLFAGWEAGEFRVQFYNVSDHAVLTEVRHLLIKAFGSTATVQVFE